MTLPDPTPALRLVVMGVSGCGKSSVGEALGRGLGLLYVDGDDLHPAANVAKMASGTPLTDEDRWPWLDRVAATLAERPCVLGCSALKRRYRDRIRQAGQVTFLHLAGPREVILARMSARKDHFMPPALLDSQFAALEPPGPDEGAITLDISQPFETLIAEALRQLAPTQPLDIA